MFAERGFNCVVHGRTAHSAAAAAQELGRKVPGSEPEWVAGDLADYSALIALGRELSEKHRPVDIVIHNAAVWIPSLACSRDGLELSIAVNFLAPFVLNHALRACFSDAQTVPRVVNVAALVHARTYVPLAEACQPVGAYQAWDAYARSKQYLIMMTYALPRYFQAHRLEAIAVHPGIIDTEMLRATGANFGAPVEEGASAVYQAGTVELCEGPTFFANGRFASPGVFEAKKAFQSSANSRSPFASRRTVRAPSTPATAPSTETRVVPDGPVSVAGARNSTPDFP